jgi:hypothetical protein
MAGTLSLQNDFGDVATVHPDRLQHFVVWDDGKVSFYEKNACHSPEIQFTAESIEDGVNSILNRLSQSGITLIRLDCGQPVYPDRPATNYSFFFVPESIEAWSDYLDDEGTDLEPALTIEGIPFFPTPEELADFKHALTKGTSPADWIELGPDAESGLQTAEGRFGFRKSRITMIFATPEDQMLVPMQSAASQIHDLAKQLPHLCHVPNGENQPRLYCDPARFPQMKPHMPKFSLSH